MSSTIIALLTLIGSVGCALTGVFVSSRISRRQVKTAEEGHVITNAEYWRKESDTMQLQIGKLRDELSKSQNQVTQLGDIIKGHKRELEELKFHQFELMVENNALRNEILQLQQGKPSSTPQSQSTLDRFQIPRGYRGQEMMEGNKDFDVS